MILRKPYAFLIKHFKLIHLLLCIPFVYLIIRFGAMSSFLSNYVRANYYTSEVNIAGTYINYFMYGAILLVILLALAIYFLMRKKEKDTKFYMAIIIYYIFLLIAITVYYSILGSIENATIEAQTVRVFRDLSYVIYLPQFFFLGYSALRGIGFDIKKFNFEEDAKELEITDIDSEEFELVIGKDAYKYKRTFRRFLREFKYYVLENKFTFGVLASIVVVVFGILLYLNFGVYNRKYSQTQNIRHNNLTVSVEDSILTNLGIDGNLIDNGKYYLALALKITNNGTNSVTLDYDNFQLEVARRRISATLDRGTYFPDFGIPYTRDTLFAPGSTGTYVLTYEIDPSLINQNIDLKILESITYEVGSITPVYKTVNLSYDRVTESKDARTVDYNKILELSETRLGVTQLQFKNYAIANSYEYSYQSCKSGNCQTLRNKIVSNSTKKLLVLERMFSIDTYTTYYAARRGSGSFVNDFITVRYTVDNRTTTTKPTNVTPRELEGYWVFELPGEIQNAETIDIILTIRGSIYTMKLK